MTRERSDPSLPPSAARARVYGRLQEYVVRLDEDTGIDIGLRKSGGPNRGVIRAGSGETSVMTRGNEGVGEQTVVFEVPRELRDTVKKGSVLLAVNNVPVSKRKRGMALAPWDETGASSASGRDCQVGRLHGTGHAHRGFPLGDRG